MARPQLKNLVADCVHDMLSSFSWGRVTKVGDVKTVTISRPTNLITQVRVVTESDGVHYYEVQVKEKI